MAVAVTPTSAARSSPATSLDEPVYIEVFFTKFSKKKKKVWEDGVLVLKQGSMELQRDDGSAVTKSNKNCSKGNAPPEPTPPETERARRRRREDGEEGSEKRAPVLQTPPETVPPQKMVLLPIHLWTQAAMMAARCLKQCRSGHNTTTL
jgi:hypothetical protein